MRKTVIILSVLALLVGSYAQAQATWQEEFNAYPLVSAEEVASIAPVIKKWTDFYNIDFAQARLVNIRTECFNCVQDTTNNLFYYKIDEIQDTDKRPDVDYSPDKQRYVNLGFAFEMNGKYFYNGFDDSQNVWLIDRKQKHATTILWHGFGGLTEDVFWESNDVLIVVSANSYENPIIQYMIDVFDIAKQTKTSYQIMREGQGEYFYMEEIYLKEKAKRGVLSVDEYIEYMKTIEQ